jgi:hypothetical protein
MKQYKAFLIAVLVTVLSFALFWAGTAYALTGCFTDTNGHWAETFICWLKSNNIAAGYPDGSYHPESGITRAEMAVMLQRIRTTGDVFFTFGGNEWQPNAASPNAYVEYFTIYTHLSNSLAGTSLFQATPVIPSSLYNSEMYIKGVQICYDTVGGSTITDVVLEHYINLDDGNYVLWNSYADPTDRTDSACRLYSFATPKSFWGDNHLAIQVRVNFPSASDVVYVTSTSVVLAPSTNPGGITALDAVVPPEELVPFDEAATGK